MLLTATQGFAARPGPVCNPGLNVCTCDMKVPGQCEEMRGKCKDDMDCGDGGDGNKGVCLCHTAKLPRPGPVVAPPANVPPVQPLPAPSLNGRKAP